MTAEQGLEQGVEQGLEQGAKQAISSTIPANPIDIASKASIDELFSMDPQFYTEENLAAIVERLRAGRGKWLQESKGSGNRSGNRSTGRGKAKLSTEQAMNLLNNLVIDI